MGRTREELADALELIHKQVLEGYVEGQDFNETGTYRYNVTND